LRQIIAPFKYAANRKLNENYKYMKKRIGVYICHCGGNISDYVDVEAVKKEVESIEGVFLAKTTMFACADSSQKEMVEDIQNANLDAVVVASCSPKLHLLTFRAVAERAGLNKYNYIHANIREQVSWAHSDNKKGATQKAIKILKAAIAKVSLSDARYPIKIKTQKAVAVVGAGVSGMRAAIELAEAGAQVYLIEREHFIGGRVAQWDCLFTTNESGKELITRLYNQVITHERIKVFVSTEIVSHSGSIGNFKLKLIQQPRYIKDKCDKNALKQAIEICPVEVSDAFNFGMTKRKAIYHNYPSEYPCWPVIDIANCTRCGLCENICKSVDFEQKETEIEINVGSILLSTGFDPYEPKKGEFGYGEIANVVTLPQFQRIVSASQDKLFFKNKEIKHIAYIYCVGSRQVDGDNKYCSRFCCTAAIHCSIETRKRFKSIYNYHFNRGIRTYGKQETLYEKSSQMGDIYLQSFEDDPTQVFVENGKTIVRINDILTGKRELDVEADLVVLVTGMVPRADNAIAHLLKVPKGRDKFFNEIHMKLRPVETVIDGITIAGACQGPKNITESINSALSAATKSFALVDSGELALEPNVAIVDANKCVLCDKCFDACPYNAISPMQMDGKSVALINNNLCKGCGMCLPVCPHDAIELSAYSDEETEAMISALITVD
jgi:heterodisulfide reductase subunit A